MTKHGRSSTATTRIMRGTSVTQRPYHIQIGPMGSGGYVVADTTPDAGTWKWITQDLGQRKVLGVEMEAAAIGRVAYEKKLPFIVAKAVMDHADKYKADGAKEFAARTSAEVLIHCLRQVVAPVVSYGGIGRDREPSPPPEDDGGHPATRQSQGPYGAAGALRPGDPMYVRRACDDEMMQILAKPGRFVHIKGDFQIGKTSLLLAIADRLAPSRSVVFMDATGGRPDNPQLLIDWLFRKLREAGFSTTSDWEALRFQAMNPPEKILILDEFAATQDNGLLMAGLHNAVHGSSPAKPMLSVVTAANEGIESILQRTNVKNPKYVRGWVEIQVRAFTAENAISLFQHLPSPVRDLAITHVGSILEYTEGNPYRLQAVCAKLYGTRPEHFEHIISDRTSYS